MADIFDRGDALGPGKVVHACEPSVGLRAVLVIDNVARGPSVGGLRMAPDVSVEECIRLARAMTLKNAAAGLAHGGGMSVLWGDARMPREANERLIRAFAHALRPGSPSKSATALRSDARGRRSDFDRGGTTVHRLDVRDDL